MMRIRRQTEAFTLIEVLIVIAIIAILAAIAFPSLLESRKSAREGDAVTVMRDIITEQEMFRARQMGGTDRYATLAELSDTPIGHIALIHWPSASAIGLRNEYQFEDVEAPTESTWCIRARPVTPGLSGDNYFAAMEDGHIRIGKTNPASRAEAAAMTSL
jgi:type IV pilus assembly protein PilE